MKKEMFYCLQRKFNCADPEKQFELFAVVAVDTEDAWNMIEESTAIDNSQKWLLTEEELSTLSEIFKKTDTKSKIHTLKGNYATSTVWLDGHVLDIRQSQLIYKHSFSFSWGYAGSGPSQLALAIMLELTGKAAGYQDFKWKHIAPIIKGNFEIEFEL